MFRKSYAQAHACTHSCFQSPAFLSQKQRPLAFDDILAMFSWNVRMKPGKAVNFGRLVQWKQGIRASVQLAMAFGLWSSVWFESVIFFVLLLVFKAHGPWKYTSLQLASYCKGRHRTMAITPVDSSGFPILGFFWGPELQLHCQKSFFPIPSRRGCLRPVFRRENTGTWCPLVVTERVTIGKRKWNPSNANQAEHWYSFPPCTVNISMPVCHLYFFSIWRHPTYWLCTWVATPCLRALRTVCFWV